MNIQSVRRKMNKITLMMILLSVLISSGFSGYDYFIQKKNLKASFAEICDPIPPQLAQSLGKPIWFGDIEMIKKIIESQMSSKRILAIVVKENESLLYAVSRDKNWNITVTDGNISGKYILRTEPIMYESKPIGQLEVYFTTRFEDEALKRIVFLMIIKVFTMSIIIVFVLLAVVKIFIIKPLSKIIQHLEQIGNEVGKGLSDLQAMTQHIIDGANRQAAAIEQTSTSLEQISAITRQNTEIIDKANQQMIKTSNTVMEAGKTMSKLMVSIDEIDQHSESTRQIIKTVDDIGFQTSLLALNAAVEAARAGQAGAGFGVVAEEVRNLANRSSQAANHSEELIEHSLQSIQKGLETASLVNEIFNSLSLDAASVKDLLGTVVSASQEQFKGINEISNAMSEIDKVTQQNVERVEVARNAFEHIEAQILSMRKEISELVNLTI